MSTNVFNFLVELLTPPNFMLIGLQLEKFHCGEGAKSTSPALPDSVKPACLGLKLHIRVKSYNNVAITNLFF